MVCGCSSPFFGPDIVTACGGNAFVLFMSLVQSIIRNTCDVTEECQRKIPRTIPRKWYDFIVVGGGSGGSVVAGRLAEERSFDVLLLEAGIEEPDAYQVPSLYMLFGPTDPQTTWQYKTEPEKKACLSSPNQRCDWPRAKILGGCSVINGMMYIRGNPKNYDDWEAAGNKGWSYKDVLPVFKRSEDNLEIGKLVKSKYHGSGGPMTVKRFNYVPKISWDILKGARQMGFETPKELNGDHITGFTVAQSTNRYGARLSAARAFVRPHRRSKNFDLMLNSTVTKLIFNKSKKAVIGVRFVYRNKMFTVRAKKEVILSAGTMNTPQIMLLSGIGPKEVLDKVGIKQVRELPGVGRNLTNHVSFAVDFKLKKMKAINQMTTANVQRYSYNRTGPLSSLGPAVTGKLNSKYADPYGDDPDLQFFFLQSESAQCSTDGKSNQPLNRSEPIAPNVLSIYPVNLQPKSRGYIELRSKNPLEAPVMVGNYFDYKEDEDILIEGIKVSLKFGSSPYLIKKYGITLQNKTYGDCSEKYKFGTDEFWRCAIHFETYPENHHTSTCRMGPQWDKFAVVDNKLRVYGIKGLRVADASVMPYVVSGNTHTTVVMIAERTAEFIKDKYSKDIFDIWF